MSIIGSPTQVDLVRTGAPVDAADTLRAVQLLAPGIVPVQSHASTLATDILSIVQDSANAYESLAGLAYRQSEIERQRQHEADRIMAQQAAYREKYEKEIEEQQKDIAAKFLSDLYVRDNTPERIDAIINSGGFNQSPEQTVRDYIAGEAVNLPTAAREFAIANAKEHTSLIGERMKARRNAAVEDILTFRAGRLVQSDPSEIAGLVEATLADKSLASKSKTDILTKTVVQAMDVAASHGLSDRFEALAATLPASFGDKVQAGRLKIQTFHENQLKDRQAADRSSVFALEASGGYEAAKRQIDASATLDIEKKGELQREILGRAQRRHFEGVSSAIEANVFKTKDELERFIIAAGQRSQDDPLFINDENRDELRRKWPKAEEQNEIKTDVLRNLNGEPVMLTSQHAETLSKAIQATGSIDENNRIADPVKLAAQLHQAGIVPSSVQQIITRGFTDPAGPDMAKSATTLLALQGSPVMASIVSETDEKDRWKLDWAADRARSGWFSTPEQSAKAAQDFKTQQQFMAEKPIKVARIQRFEAEYNKGTKPNDPKPSDIDAASIVESLHPGTTPWIDATDVVSNELSIAFDRHRTANIPHEEAKKRAIQDATAVVRRKLMETSWNGQRRVNPSYDINDGPSAGVVMPHKWTVLDEEDAANALDAAGFGDKKNRIVGFRAVTNRAWKDHEPQSRRVGLAFETDTGDLITNDRGEALLFFPMLRTDFQTELELNKRPKAARPIWSASIAGAVQ